MGVSFRAILMIPVFRKQCELIIFTADTPWSPCDWATASSSGHSTSKANPRLPLGLGSSLYACHPRLVNGYTLSVPSLEIQHL